jgi:phosphatidylglycerol:prolipoprotein diacylglycerol transferase
MIDFLLVDRVAFSIGNFDVYWYGVLICLAILVAIVVASVLCKKRKLQTDLALTVALVILPTGILCGRLFAVLLDSSLSIYDYFEFRTGGMSIIGAIVGGGLGLLIYCIIKKEKNPLLLFDVLCSVLLLAQAIGRWGNFFNSEVYGGVISSSSWFARFPFAVEIDGVFYQALFFYESCADLVGFIIAYNIFLYSKKTGLTTGFYLLYYGIVRTILEPLRQPEFIYTYGGVAVSRLLSIVMIAIGAIMILTIFIRTSKNRKEVKNEKEN